MLLEIVSAYVRKEGDRRMNGNR